MFFQQLAHLLGFFALRIWPHAHANLVAGFFGISLETQFFQPACFLLCGFWIGVSADLRDEAFAFAFWTSFLKYVYAPRGQT